MPPHQPLPFYFIRLLSPSIHKLLVVLPPRAQVAFLGDKLGGFAVIGLQDIDGFFASQSSS